MRTYVQLDLGKRPSEPGGDVAITLDDARYLVAHERGHESWDGLAASVAKLPAGAPLVMTPLEARAQRLREALERGDATELDLGGVQGSRRRRARSDRPPDAPRTPQPRRHRRSPTPAWRTCAGSTRCAT